MNNSTVIPERRLRFSATISFRDGSQSAQATTVATILGSSLPTLSIGLLANKYNVEDKIVIKASASSNSGAMKVVWESRSFDVTAAAITPTQFSYPTSGVFLIELGMKPNSFVPGQTYALTLKASYGVGSNQFAEANIQVVMNSPPTGGYVTVSPGVGSEMITLFYFRALLWQDDPSDYPLSYSMSYYQVDASDQVFIKPSGQSSSVKALLSRGLVSNGYNVTSLTTVSDSYDCSSQYTLEVKVKPVQNVNVLVTSITASIENAFKKIDTSLVSQLISGATTTMNSVNCTIQLPSSINKDCQKDNDCAACLNRQVCSRTAKTCGPCLTGYFGLEGDSNTPCMASVRPNGAGCRSNTDCISGRCSQNVCLDQIKSCPNACTQKGTCKFFDLYGSIVNTCTVSDQSCSAACVCQSGYYGSDCSMVAADFQTFKKMRENLCVSMYASIQITDVTADVIVSRATNVANILKDSSQVTASALGNCSLVLLETMFDSSTDALRPEIGNDATMNVVSSALSKILDYGNMLSPALKARVQGGISNLTLSRQNALVVGEPGTGIQTAAMRLFASKQSAESLANGVTTEVPRSAYEAINNFPVPSVQISSNQRRRRLDTGALSPVGISLIQYNKNKGNNNSTSLTIQATYSGSPNLQFSLLLINKGRIQYFERKPKNNTIVCLPSQEERQLSAQCDDSPGLTVTCPGNMAFGEVHVVCPGVKKSPVCTRWDDVSGKFVMDGNCYVKSYSEYNTTCVCDFNALPGRRLSIGSSLFSEEYSTSFRVTTTTSTSFFLNKGSFYVEAVEKNQVIVIVAGIIVGAALIGLLGLVGWEFSPRRGKSKLEETFGHESGDNFSTVKNPRTLKSFFAQILPPEFDDKPWYQRLWQKLFVDHDWLFIVFKSPVDRSAKDDLLFRSEKWIVAMGRILNILFIDTILAGIYFADDGSCQKLSTQAKCESTSNIFFAANTCRWVPYDGSCTFQAPKNNFLPVLITSSIIVILMVPLDKLIRYMVAQNKLFYKDHPFCNFGFAQRNIITAATHQAQVTFVSGKDGTLIVHKPTSPQSSTSLSKASLKSSKLVVPIDSDSTGFDDDNSAIMTQGPAVMSQVPDKGDEWKEIQVRSTIMMQACRLFKIQEEMDFIKPDEEMRILIANVKKDALHKREYTMTASSNVMIMALKRRIRSFFFEFDDIGDPLTASEFIYHAGVADRDMITRKLDRARQRAEKLKVQLHNLSSDDDRDLFLMKRFIVDSMRGLRHEVAYHYFFGLDEKKVRYRNQCLFRYLSVILLPLYFILAAVFAFQYAVTIGAKATNFWLLSCLITVVYDAVLLQPLKILMKWVVIIDTTRPIVRELFKVLEIRSSTILRRKTGLMKNTNSLIQHFNPACRAARSFPQLPISRLLMSFNDFDLPKISAFSQEGFSKSNTPMASTTSPLLMDRLDVAFHNISILMYQYANGGLKYLIVGSAVILFAIMGLPELFQDGAIEVLMVAVVNSTVVALYFSNAVNIAVFTALLVILISALLYIAYKRYRLGQKLASRRAKDEFPEPFDYMDKDAKLNEIRHKMQHHMYIYKRPNPPTLDKSKIKNKVPAKLSDPLHSAIFKQHQKSNKIAVMPTESYSDDDPATEDVIARILAPHSTMKILQAPPIASKMSKSIDGKSFFGNSVSSIDSKGSKDSLKLKSDSVVTLEVKSNKSPHKLNVPSLDQIKNSSIVSNGTTIRASLPPLKVSSNDMIMSDIETDDFTRLNDKRSSNQEERDEDRRHRRKKGSNRNDEKSKRRKKEKLKSLHENDDDSKFNEMTDNNNAARNRRRRRRYRSDTHDDDFEQNAESSLQGQGPGSFMSLHADDKLGSAMASRGLAYVSNDEAHQDISLNRYLASVPPSMEKDKTEDKSLKQRSASGFDSNYRSLQQQHRNSRLQPLKFTTPLNSRNGTDVTEENQSPVGSILPSPIKQALPPLVTNDEKASKAPGAPISDNDKGYQPRYPMWN